MKLYQLSAFFEEENSLDPIFVRRKFESSAYAFREAKGFYPEYENSSFRFLRCVFPVVLSNNKNKLLVHMYIVKNTTIFLILRLL